jgi:hypothetical protein
MRIDSFTIFLIVLIVFVTIILITNWYKYHSCKETESFVDFNANENTGSTVYIPQYSDKDTKSVVSLYDNMYYDYKNGNLIEVSSTSSGKKDTTGESIKNISIVTRDGLAVKKISSQALNADGTVPVYSSPESLVNSITPLYNQFSYKTGTTTTHPYQAFYISWNKDTYLHLVNLDGKKEVPNGTEMTGGVNLKTFTFNDTGLKNTTSTYNISNLPSYSSVTNAVSVSCVYNSNKKYLDGKNKLFEIAKTFHKTDRDSSESTHSGTSGSEQLPPINEYDQSTLYFDPLYGNIILDNGKNIKVYNRQDSGKPLTDRFDSVSFSKLSSTNVFIIDDMYPYAAVMVIAEKNHTIISVICPNTNSYTLLTSVRFNINGLVNNEITDTENKVVEKQWNDNDGVLNQPPKLDMAYDSNPTHSKVCGDDLSCKWYWYFNSIDKTSKDNVLSDDYFLKTEVVPPVCPQCPMCPDSGICSNCGGRGGAGVCNVSTDQKLTPSPTVPGTFVDSSGNVFVLYTDPNGNKSYMPLSRMKPDNVVPATATTTVGTNTVNPNTIGGALSSTVTGAEKLGSTAITTTGSLANKLVDTAGNVVDTAGNIVSTTIGTAADLAKGVGSGIMQLGSGRGGNIGSGVSSGGTPLNTNVVGGVGTPIRPVSDKTFGNIPGQTQVDNYSYYGALQSKGSTYMPVTADFSSFRK